MSNLSGKKKLATGAVLTTVVCASAMVGGIVAFLANASPYMNVAQAMASRAGEVHVAGDIVKDSVHRDFANNLITFDVKDNTGKVSVIYTGIAPQDMGEATKVVAIGSMKD